MNTIRKKKESASDKNNPTPKKKKIVNAEEQKKIVNSNNSGKSANKIGTQKEDDSRNLPGKYDDSKKTIREIPKD